MKIHFGLVLAIGLVLVGSSQGLETNFVEGGESFVVTNDLDRTGYLIGIGLTTSNNSLELASGYYMTSDAAVVGGGAEADSNAVRVKEDGSYWYVDGDFTVGESGSMNSLDVADGGWLDAETLRVGREQSSGSNSVMVSGANLSVAGELVIGDAGSSNRMDIVDGGVVDGGDSWVGAQDSALNNVVSVSGAGSAWWNYGTLHIGTASNSGNRVAVSDHGVVTADGLVIEGAGNSFDLNDTARLTVGSDFDASMAGFNFNEGGELFVGGDLTGASSTIEGRRTIGITSGGQWNQSGTNIVIGATTSGNGLAVERGGRIVADNIMVGTGADTDDNLVLVNGFNSRLFVDDSIVVGTVSNSGNLVTVTNGGIIAVGSGLAVNGTGNAFDLAKDGWLVASNNFDASMAGFNFGEGGILKTTGSLTGMSNTLDSGRQVYLSGGAAEWDRGLESLNLNGSAVHVGEGALLAGSGASLADASQVFIDGSGSAWSNSGSLNMTGDDNALWIENGGVVANADATVGSSGNGNLVDISGTNSQWAVNGALGVGNSGSNNRLQISGGGRVDSMSAMIGNGLGGSGNLVLVEGAGSLWMNSGNLTVGGSGNMLMVEDSANVVVGQTLSVRNQSTITFASGGQVSASNYYQDATSTLSFGSVTNLAVDPGPELLTVSGAAEFEADATVAYTGVIADLAVGVTNSKLLVASGTLIVGGVTNATAADLDVLNGSLLGGGLMKMDFFALNDDLYALLLRQRLAESAGFADGSDMAAVSDEIDQMASDGNPAAVSQLNILTQLNGTTQNAQLSQLYDRNAPSYAHVGGMMEGFRQTRRRGVMPDSMWPVGVQGPHLHGDQIQGWIKGYGSWGNRDGSSDFSTYDHSIYGMVVGVDKAFGELLAGLAGGYATSDISQDDGDNSTAGTGYGLVYASWGTADWFGDLNLGYGRSSIEADSGTLFDSTAEFGADQLGFYAGGGKEMVFRNDQLFLTPSAGLLGSYYAQEGYSEQATTAVPRNIDAYDHWSLQSELGLKASFQREYDKFVLMPETHASWLHEFNSDVDRVGYSLAGGTGHYTFGMHAPVEDLFEIGLGLSLWTEGKEGTVFEWALGLDGRYGDGYSAAALNARMLVEF